MSQAEGQARMLGAPSVARDSAWNGTVLARAALGTVGLVLLGVGVWGRRR